MNSLSSNNTRPLSAGDRRFPAELAEDLAGTHRFAPDKGALKDALKTVRALDADSYQALLWALGLSPDPRLSVPGCAQRGRPAGGPAGCD